MDAGVAMADLNPSLLAEMADVMDAPVQVNRSLSFSRFTWRRFIADTTSCYRLALNPDELDHESGTPLFQFWFFQFQKRTTAGTSIWTLRDPNRFPKLASDTLGWNTFHLKKKLIPILITMSTTSFTPASTGPPVLLPTLNSFNELLSRWVLFQKQKSTQKFMVVYKRSGQADGQFDQEFFQRWLTAELEQMDTFYLLDFFKRMIKETITPDGFEVTRIFPRMEQACFEKPFCLITPFSTRKKIGL